MLKTNTSIIYEYFIAYIPIAEAKDFTLFLYNKSESILGYFSSMSTDFSELKTFLSSLTGICLFWLSTNLVTGTPAWYNLYLSGPTASIFSSSDNDSNHCSMILAFLHHPRRLLEPLHIYSSDVMGE